MMRTRGSTRGLAGHGTSRTGCVLIDLLLGSNAAGQAKAKIIDYSLAFFNLESPVLLVPLAMSPMKLHPEGNPKPELIPLDVPVPPQLAEALGYHGKRRFVCFHWELGGEALLFNDGRHLGIGCRAGFVAYLNHRTVRPHFARYREMETTYTLVIDRTNNLAGVLQIRALRPFLKRQRSRPPELTPEQTETAQHPSERRPVKGRRKRRIHPSTVRPSREERRQAVADMVSYLNRWPQVE